MKVILTSESQIKLKAVQEVFSEHKIECFKTKTYLEQPFTQEETYALNMLRVAEALKNYVPEVIISIESGIDLDDNGYYDFANVIVYFNRDKIWSYYSDKVYIPTEFNTLVDKAIKTQETTALGQLISEVKPECDPKGWSEGLGLMSRKDQIKTALVKIKDLGVL